MSALDNLNERKQATVFIAPNVKLGKDVRFFGFNNVYGCEIDDGTRIGTFVEIQKGSKIGANCKISSHTFICEGVEIGNNCFIGHGVVFINDRFPAAVNSDGSMKTDADWVCEKTIVGNNVSIGSAAVIMCGIKIGDNALIGAGAVVTKDVLPSSTVVGVPARLFNK